MTMPPDPANITIGKYQVLDLAGEGAMGAVYRARDTVLNRLVAVKVMNATIARDPELRNRFLREAQSAGSLQHPNVVTIYDFGETDGHLYIAMEYVEGTDLETMMRDPEGMTLQLRLELTIDVLAGLGYAHQHGIVHRDLKPANIRVTPEPRAKLMDFGVAHLESSKMTKTGMMVGTPNYMAPEYISGSPITAASDIFSMGAVLYELLTGRKPFVGDTLHALFFSVLQEVPPAPSSLVPGLPTELDAIVYKAIAKEPADRYASALDMAHALTRVRASLSGAPFLDTQALSTTLAHRIAVEGGAVARDAASRHAASKGAASGEAASGDAASGGAASRGATPVVTDLPARADGNAATAAAPPRLRFFVGGGLATVAAAVALFVVLRGDRDSDVPAPAGATSPSASDGQPTAVVPATSAAAVPGAAALATRATRSDTGVNREAGSGDTMGSRVATVSRPGARADSRPDPRAHAPSREPPALERRVPAAPPSAPASVPPAALPPTSPPVVSPPAIPTAVPATVMPQPRPPAATPPADAPVARIVQEELREIIGRYARAISSRDPSRVRAAFPGISRAQLKGFEDYFGLCKQLQATLVLSVVDVRDSTADGRVSGRYECNGRPEKQAVTFLASFERDGDRWRLVSTR